MLDYIKSISERCYNTAVKRGKDVTREGCILALMQEFKELKHAVAHRSVADPSALYTLADQKSDADFMAAYILLLHNTVLDEVADVFITIATSFHVDQDDIILTRALDAAKCKLTPGKREMMEQAIALKMRYNDLRKD